VEQETKIGLFGVGFWVWILLSDGSFKGFWLLSRTLCGCQWLRLHCLQMPMNFIVFVQ